MNLLKRWAVLLLCSVAVFKLVVPVNAQDGKHELAFANGDIYTVDTDSGIVTQLTHTDLYSTSPIWSADGSQIAFVETLTSDFYGQYGLYVMNSDGSNPVQIAADLVWRSEPVWLNGDTILYATSSEIKGGDCIIKSVKRDGSEPHEILHQTHKKCDVSGFYPALSPDNTQLIFKFDEQDDGKYFQLYKLDLVSGQVDQLTHNRANNSSPQWSPDGTQIAFVTILDTQREIYVMDADGSNVRRLTHRPGNDYAPRWLPDGTHLIFASDQGGYNIFSLDVSSGVVRNLTQLTDSGAWNQTLSPYGTQIAYATGRDPVGGPEHIYVMSLDTGDTHELLNVGSDAYALMWRP